MSPYQLVFQAIRAQLNAETLRRGKRAIEVWIVAERECVLREVNHQRGLLAYDPLGLADVERAERMAVGHSDYLSKYAHAATDLVLSPRRSAVPPLLCQVRACRG